MNRRLRQRVSIGRAVSFQSADTEPCDQPFVYQELRRQASWYGSPIGFYHYRCADAIAIYHELIGRGIAAERPFVGNGLWVTTVMGPDGYRLDFESPTEVPEGTVYSDAPAT